MTDSNYELKDKGIWMGIKQRKNLRVIEGYKGSVSKKIDNLKAKLKIGVLTRKQILIIAGVLVAALVLLLIVNFQTYTTVKVSDTYSVAGAADSNYQRFAEGVLKYSRDGISYLNLEGEEQWNLPYQIKTPFVEVNDVSAAVADKGGNHIMIFQEDGLKGEIKTTLPVEKLAISEQGIVSVILKNESAPRIVCYDIAGNILVEHKITLSGMGYPMDVAVSADGQVLQVSYMHVHGGKLLSKVAYYNFSGQGKSTEDYQIAYKEYSNTILAEGFYMDDKTSVVAGDNCITIFEGDKQIEEVATLAFDKEIQSLGYNDEYIAVVLQNSGETGYELQLYNKDGKMVTNESFKGNYRNIKVSGNQVIMYDGKECTIFLKNGVKKFEGEMNSSILEIIPASGANNYIVMNANGMENVRLKK